MVLREEASLQVLYLRSLHVFGRNATKADTFLTSQEVSQIHASIRWNGHGWELIDHSRNGTFVNGRRLPANEKFALAVGMKIRFSPGSPQSWIVENLEPPAPMLLKINSDSPAIALKTVYFLPNDLEPQASVHRSAQGYWLWQSGDDSLILKDGDVVNLPPHSWRFFDAQRNEATQDVREVQLSYEFETSFSFNVSQNEEHVVLAVTTAGRQANLGERTHHYGLLTLARRRVSDAQRGLDISAQGWLSVEQLSIMLGVAPSNLNMQLFRARGQIAHQFPERSDLLDVVERRRGEVRFAAMPFEIIRGSQLEARFDPQLMMKTIPVNV
jgi:hypothetical protein